MTNGRKAAEEHPVLVREVVRRDGSRAPALRVFCSRRAASVPLETCEACPSCVDIAPDEDGVGTLVRCQPPHAIATIPRTDRPRGMDDPPGEATLVGSILRGGTLCVASDAEVPALRALSVERALLGLFIVDNDGRLVGLVRDVNLLRAVQPTPDAGPLAALEARDVNRADAVMSTATSVWEDISVRRAIRCMASAHLREIPVVTREGQLVGVLRDIDGLRWIAAEQHRKR